VVDDEPCRRTVGLSGESLELVEEHKACVEVDRAIELVDELSGSDLLKCPGGGMDLEKRIVDYNCNQIAHCL